MGGLLSLSLLLPKKTHSDKMNSVIRLQMMHYSICDIPTGDVTVRSFQSGRKTTAAAKGNKRQQ